MKETRGGSGGRQRRHGALWTMLHNAVTKCNCKGHPRYADYGGRGVCVCDSWYDRATGKHDLEAFTKWAVAHGYSEGCGLRLVRKDPNGNYSPRNCALAPSSEVARRRRSTVNITICGETKCATDWCAVSGVQYKTFCSRTAAGWDPVLAATVPNGIRRAGLAKRTPPFRPLDNPLIAAYFAMP